MLPPNRKTLPEASRTHQSTGLQASRTQPPYSMTVQTDNSNAKNTPFTNRNTRLEASPGIYITQRTMIGSSARHGVHTQEFLTTRPNFKPRLRLIWYPISFY